VLFEYGWVGFVLLLATFVELAYELFKAKESTLFALLISVAASAIFAYPARYFPTAIVCAVIILGSYLHVNSISDSPRLD
jgi:asparagine N-glycosylation enzyme membrane subunit Stt3